MWRERDEIEKNRGRVREGEGHRIEVPRVVGGFLKISKNH